MNRQRVYDLEKGRGDCLMKWLIMLGFMDLRGPRVCRRSTPALFSYVADQTESFEIFKQKVTQIATFDQLAIAKFCPKQEIIDVITKSKVNNELWIKWCIIHHGMNVALRKGIVDFFKFEISNFMLDTSNIFAISNTDINSKKVSYL